MNPRYQVVPFEAWHMFALLAGNCAEGLSGEPADPLILKYLEQCDSQTLVVDGVPILCGGTIKQWNGRYTGWAFLSANAGKHMLLVTRTALRLLARAEGRVECTVRKDFVAGHRWTRMLGFFIETPVLRQYGPEGEDHTGYVRFSK